MAIPDKILSETKEGLDRTMSLIYYSRIRFIVKLMPLLLAASQPAHVVSVFAGGMEAKLFQDDLSLRNPKNFGGINVRSHCTYFTTMTFERLAKQHEQVSFVHVFPGIVITPAYVDPDFPIWFKTIWRIVSPIVRRFFAITPEESGSRTVYLGTNRFAARRAAESAGKSTDTAVGTDGVRGSGAYAVNANSEEAVSKVDLAKLRKSGFEDTVWKHTWKVFDVIESGQVFAD
jgi:hypothetical protein